MVHQLSLLIIISCLPFLECSYEHEHRAHIKSQNGDLILQPARNRNIRLLTNGLNSKILVNDVPITNGSAAFTDQPENPDNRSIVDGLLLRVMQLEARALTPLPNNTNVRVRLNRLHNRVTRLEAVVGTRSTRCQAAPCRNGGTCLNLPGDYHCLCPPAWEGKDCDQDVNECRQFVGTELGCQNGATCINRPGSYECLCRAGWFGLHCTRRERDCSAGDVEMCGHGVCLGVASGSGVTCLCDQGWTKNSTDGPCLTDVDECATGGGARCSANPPVACVNLPGSFRCGACPPGYSGDGYACADVDECATDHGGCSPLVACHNTVGSRLCGHCPPPYVGDGVTCTWRGSCATNNGGCHPSAQCLDTPAPACVCPAGTEGDGRGPHGCFVPGGDCSSDHCGPHGVCRTLPRGYTCLCLAGYGGPHCDAAADPCASSPCLNGGTCRGAAAGGFRCECPPRHAGSRCQAAAQCGRILRAAEGSILHPAGNSSFNQNSKCAWLIAVAADKVINVTFTKFDTQETPDCAKEFLQIHDGPNSASQLLGRFCGKTFPNNGNIISTHNTLYLWFLSDWLAAGRGFSLRWASAAPACGGRVAATQHGRLNSPGAPARYPPSRDCYWHLAALPGKRIQLHFFELDIETHANCSYDFLAIYEGTSTSDPLLNKYCNSTQPAPVTSTSSDVYIHFHSDATGSGRGFQIAYAPVEGIPGCGGLHSGDRGEVRSPSNDGHYNDNLLCEYEIKTSQGTRIRLDFKSFNLEYSSNCELDYLAIHDGGDASAPVVGKFCGRNLPRVYTSSSNRLFLKFRSDSSLSGEGFRVIYQAICHQMVIGDSGVIKSPKYPFPYPDKENCEYVLNAPPGRAIVLTFQDFDIEYNAFAKCQFDYLEVHDGHDASAPLLGTFCGATAPSPLTSTHNYMYLKFVSDISQNGVGFYANFTTVDVKCGGIIRNTSGIINYPAAGDAYESETTCTWLLVAPEGKHIRLSWLRFDLEDESTCDFDYLELVEGSEKESVGKFCGRHSPPDLLTTTSNQLNITFVSDYSVEAAGFSLSYSFLDDGAHCGGVYRKSHGYIRSPGWPQTYRNNEECVWVITVPVGQRVTLNISQFQLERTIMFTSCRSADYVEIRNGATSQAPLIGKYCGRVIPKRITSFGNSLYIKFVSDSFDTGSGFEMEWDGSLAGCGGTATAPIGSISSPNYPSTYDDDLECFYRITVNPGSRIRIVITELDLEETRGCYNDYVMIFDGRDGSAQSLGRYCFKQEKPTEILTTSNQAFIKFRSDLYDKGNGFLINYYTFCRDVNVTGNYGAIESPGYPNIYSEIINCVWNIIVPKGSKINITFTDLSLNRNIFHRFRMFRTRQSHVQVVDSGQVYDYIENKNLPKLTSKGNVVEIKYFTGSFFYQSKGFRLEWSRYGCGGHLRRSYGVVGFDRASSTVEEIECEWIIEGNYGSSVYLTFSDVFLMDSPNCTTDAIEIYDGQSVDSHLIARICHRRVYSFSSSSNFMLVRMVKQSRLRDTYFKATFYPNVPNCGNRIIASSGLIHSQNYPKNYDNNLNCVWHIVVPVNHRIELNFVDFDLYDENKDCGDQIRIYNQAYVFDNKYSQLICPSSNVTQIISKSHILNVEFKSNAEGTAKGFKANFTAICGATINVLSDGILQNDDFITHSNRNCSWTLLAPNLNQKIQLTLTHLSLPKNRTTDTNRNCPSSFLRVLDGDDDDAPLIDEFCGKKVPPTIISRGSAMTVQLGSYTGPIIGKFSAHYTSVDTACGGMINSEEGSIASPNYPLPYPNNAYCEWTLTASPGNAIYVTFEAFNLEDSENCNEDYLELREKDGGGKLLGLYCGSTKPFAINATSSVYVKFHSDSEETAQGFLMHFGYSHSNEILKSSGELTSPLYPQKFIGQSDFTWLISTPTATTDKIVLSIVDLEIPNYGLNCENSLSIYDGYDDEAPLIKSFCGIEKSDVRPTSNVVYLKFNLDETNTGSKFQLKWHLLETYTDPNEVLSNINCGNNVTELIPVGGSKTITSPNYPNTYDQNTQCEWSFRASRGRHLLMIISDIKLEEYMECKADYISIFSSKTGVEWKPISENVCTHVVHVRNRIESSTYMKVTFTSDSSFNDKGFSASINSRCGGFLSEPSGEVDVIWEDWKSTYALDCEWTIKVKPGRTVGLNFLHFNISNSDQCVNFISLRNGESIESPLLGTGKYCGLPEENRGTLETSGNTAFIKYSVRGMVFQNFRLYYEEKSVECGSNSILDLEHSFETISSPNYPSVPQVYSECVWTFTGPPGEILRIDFVGRFDLERDCEKEFVEIRDGSSELSPIIRDKFCGSTAPDTIKTTNNVMYIRYVTQILEPRNGFKANVTIDTCGGTIHASSGEIKTPGYPNLNFDSGKSPFTCEWKIIGVMPSQAININPVDISIPEAKFDCGTNITIEEVVEGKDTNLLKTICGSSDDVNSIAPIQTSSNVAVIKFSIGPSDRGQNSQMRGFHITFNTTRNTCRDYISASEGYISTPGYPRETSIHYCSWVITAPNRSRKIRLQVLEQNEPSKQRLKVADDQFHLSQIEPKNETEGVVYESVGNKMVVALFMGLHASKFRFKAKFTSEESALCGASLSARTGEIRSLALDRPFVCEWNIVNDPPEDDSVDLPTQYNSILLNGTLLSTSSRERCNMLDSHIELRYTAGLATNQFRICNNSTMNFRLPSSLVTLKALRAKHSGFDFDINYKKLACGGSITVGLDPINILTFPAPNSGPVDCAWLIRAPVTTFSRIQIKLSGSFVLSCSDEFLQIGRGVQGSLQSNIGDYCRDRMQNEVITTNFRLFYVQYHSERNATDLQLIINTVNDKDSTKCGGLLTGSDYFFSSPNFPRDYFNNRECSWEINSDIGTRIALKFIQRFVVEQTKNCSKDAVLIYDWVDNAYNQVARLCGRDLPPVFNSTSTKMKVVFRTDGDTTLDGFKASWTPICGGKLMASDREQYIYSPRYPYKYLRQMKCEYEITGPINKNVVLKFIDFDLEGPYPDCIFDNLTINDRTSYYDIVTCGSHKPDTKVFYNPALVLTFQSDRFVERTGFKIAYSVYNCGGVIRTPTVLTESEAFHEIENLNCTWRIEAPKHKIVVLKITKRDLGNCEFDYLEAFDSDLVDYSKRIAKMCGRDNSTKAIRSSGRNMTLQLNSYYGNVKYKVEVAFSFGESVGCGGTINVTSTYQLNSPIFIGNNYTDLLDCHWSLIAPRFSVLKIEFTSFSVIPCTNQTNDCNCDAVEMRDGLNPNSLLMGRYCGELTPPDLTSSGNTMSVRLFTDAHVISTGFSARVSIQPSLCGQTHFRVTKNTNKIRTPGYEVGTIPRGLHCVYSLSAAMEPGEVSAFVRIHLRITNMDLRSGALNNTCDRDKLLIQTTTENHNTSGTNLVVDNTDNSFFSPLVDVGDHVRYSTPMFIFCGKNDPIDLYVSDRVQINVITSPESDNVNHRGVEIEFKRPGFCPRNFTETQGRISTTFSTDSTPEECFTLITAPQNSTISLYFSALISIYDRAFLEIHDGDCISSPLVSRIADGNQEKNPVFSTGRHLFLHSKVDQSSRIAYDLNYVTTDKGRGCGGQLKDIHGTITSPFYPSIYRVIGQCEWELETPKETFLELQFEVFDLGRECDENYVQLVDRQGLVYATYCSRIPATYRSNDNYVKVVYKTNRNNGGLGWVAKFFAIGDGES